MAGKVVDILKYIIGVDTKDLQKGAKVADRRVKDMSTSIKRSLGAVGAAFIAAFGIHRMMGLVKNVTMTAARAEELAIVLKNVGKTAGYSAQYLMQEEEKIKALGITTQATRMLMIRFMQSQLDVAKAAKIARAAQDFAVIGMVDSSEAAKMLTFAIAAQCPRLLRQFGIVTDLAEVFGRYAKAHNKSAEDLTEHEKRMSFYNVIMENAARITGTYEAAMTTAGKQFRSLQRYVIEASNAIGKYFLPTFSELVIEITEALIEVRKFFDPLGAMISQYTKLERIFNESTGTINKLIDRYDELTDKAQKTEAEHNEYAQIIDKLIGLMPELSREYDAYGNVLIGNADALREVIKLHREELGLKKAEVVGKLKEEIRETKEEIAGLSERYERLAGGEYEEYWAKMIKFTTGRLRERRLELIRLEGQLRILQPLYGPMPLPPGEDAIIKIEQFSDAILKTRLWLLDQQRKYDKINEAEYLASLKRMLDDTRYTEEQKVLLKRMYLEQLLQMEKTYAEGKKAIEQAGLDFIEESDEKIIAGMEELNEQLTEQLDEAAEKRIEQLEKQLAFELSIYQAVGNAAARTFSDIFTSGKSLSKALKDGWKSFMDSVVNILANMLAKFIYTSLAELARHTATEKAKTAVTAVEASKRAALSVGGPFALPLMFFKGGGLVGMQGGGLVRGLQTTRDNILAALSAGEFVMPRPAVQRIGVPALEHMRRTGSVSRGGGSIHFTMGDVTIGQTGTPRDYFLFEEFKDAMVELIEEKIKNRDLVL